MKRGQQRSIFGMIENFKIILKYAFVFKNAHIRLKIFNNCVTINIFYATKLDIGC